MPLYYGISHTSVDVTLDKVHVDIITSQGRLSWCQLLQAGQLGQLYLATRLTPSWCPTIRLLHWFHSNNKLTAIYIVYLS